MYWILSNEFVDEDRDADLSGDVNLELGDDISFLNGISIGASIPKVVLTLNDECHLGTMTDHLSIDEVYGLVFSPRLRALIYDLGVRNIQYFDLDIVSPAENKTYTDYKIANIVGVADCVDKNKSDIDYFKSGNIRYIDKLVLDESKIPPELKVFRLANDTATPVFHQSVRDGIVNAGITGCVFYKPEDYQV